MKHFYEEELAYTALIEGMGALRMGDIRQEEHVRLLHLDGTWGDTVATLATACLFLEKAKAEFGMSGSPIMRQDGRTAVGGFTCGHREPRLAVNLPGWLLRALRALPPKAKQPPASAEAVLAAAAPRRTRP
jgi:hypothetical protein